MIINNGGLLVPIIGEAQESESPPLGGGGRWFNSAPPSLIDWQQFHNFLLQRMTAKTAEDRLRYAKQFVSVLTNGDAQSLLSAPPNKRIHIMDW
jgi:hypothetical protein